MKFSLFGIVATGFVCVFGALLAFTAFKPMVFGEWVDPGNIGLLVNNYGDARGIENAVLSKGGRVNYNPWTHTLYEFPSYYRTFVFDKQGDEDHRVAFSVKGTPVRIPISLTYRYREDAIDKANPNLTYIHLFFQDYRVSPEVFASTILRNGLRDCATSAASVMSPTEFATQTIRLQQPLQECLASKYPAIEFQFPSFGNAELPENVQKSINEAFTAQQSAITAESNKKKVEAETLAAVAKADGEAKVTIVKANAEAAANKAIAGSITPELIKLRQIDIEQAKWNRWNGQFAPTVQSPNVQVGSQPQPQPQQ